MDDVQVSKFNFAGNVVKSGSKVTASANPTMTSDTTKDKFTLDNQARRLLKLEADDRVCLIDMGGNGTATEDRYFITKGFELNGDVQGAKVAENGAFSYGQIWSAMLLNDVDKMQATSNDLVKLGLAEFRKSEKNGKTTIIAKKKGFFELHSIGINTVSVGIDQEVFALKNITFKDHTPKVMGASVEEDED